MQIGLTATPRQLIIGEPHTPGELDERLLLPERVLALSQHLLEQLIAHGGTPEQKTILFCASDRHAAAMSEQLGNLYQDWCRTHGRDPKAYFAFKFTAKSGGADHVPDVRGSASSHFIACTVELLSTGVDVMAATCSFAPLRLCASHSSHSDTVDNPLFHNSNTPNAMTENEISRIVVDAAVKLHQDLGPGLQKADFNEYPLAIITKLDNSHPA